MWVLYGKANSLTTKYQLGSMDIPLTVANYRRGSLTLDFLNGCINETYYRGLLADPTQFYAVMSRIMLLTRMTNNMTLNPSRYVDLNVSTLEVEVNISTISEYTFVTKGSLSGALKYSDSC